jgi:alpha-tubulin suppressor-like RCC1 family protein
MSQLPIPVTEIKNRKIMSIGAGDFSACVTTRGELLIWGLPGLCKVQDNKKRIVVKYEMDNRVSNVSLNGKNAVLLDETGKI